ncbi:hypothetical protein AX17_005529 [Amanita inopinata Kibby_2008]|nr:hypothetical protein AX17_005529 [Amanita inopinata Kibby_2008]
MAGIIPALSYHSRFQSIINTTPSLDDLRPLGFATTDSVTAAVKASCSDGAASRKRQRMDETRYPEAGPSNIDRVLEIAAANEVTAPREYADRHGLVAAMRQRFMDTQDVQFAGSFPLLDAKTTHKQLIQIVLHEVWKATGYRFTVKDYPRIKNGFKTRLVCSQDEANCKSRVVKAAVNQTQTDDRSPTPLNAEMMGKSRYQCRSRLLISTKETAQREIRIVTVRMHHRVAHEPYYDFTLPPEVSRTVWENMGWMTPALISSGPSSLHSPNPHIGPETEWEKADDDDAHNAQRSSCHQVEVGGETGENGAAPTASASERIQTLPLQDSESFKGRMRRHISTIRDFCDGLEYQLQFNDYRMLETLEKEGGSFLRFARDCLEKERQERNWQSASKRVDLDPGASSHPQPDRVERGNPSS